MARPSPGGFLGRTLRVIFLMAFSTFPGFGGAISAASPTVVVVVGAEGEAEFGTNFVRQATLWKSAATQASAPFFAVGLDPQSATQDVVELERLLADQTKTGVDALWLVLLGHGTFDGHEARFNLRGPDLPASRLALWLGPFERPVVIIDTSSSSAPFIQALSATNRVILTATRSGNEQNFTRFGLYLAEAITDPLSDLDQDGQISLLEAFLSAAHRVAEFYQTESRLATEHALIDDNGDHKGTPADWFRGVRVIKKSRDSNSPDGARAHQLYLRPNPLERNWSPENLAKRNALELQLAKLRDSKGTVPSHEYTSKLESLLLTLARLYEEAGTH